MSSNVMIIAGYDVLADKNPFHRDYIKMCIRQTEREYIDIIVLTGGATNPNYPHLTEAEANYRIIKDSFYQKMGKTGKEVVVLPFGNTAMESLSAVKLYFERRGKKNSINKLVLCAEQSRIASFMFDALGMGLLDLSREIAAYGHYFPESKDNFDAERKKMLLRVLSYRSRIFLRIRNFYQKIHQKKMTRLKEKE